MIPSTLVPPAAHDDAVITGQEGGLGPARAGFALTAASATPHNMAIAPLAGLERQSRRQFPRLHQPGVASEKADQYTPPDHMGVVDRIVERAERLTASERKVAEILAGDPQAIAFGTVAEVAKRAGTSGPSVVRLAVKLGYAGFVEMQGDVQQELARQLASAHDRIRQRPPTDLVSRTRDVELANVEGSLRNLQDDTFSQTVTRLSDRSHHVWILAADAMKPVGLALAGQLSQLRESVDYLDGSEVAVSRRLAGHEQGDALIAIDIRRYERWLVGLATFAARQGVQVTALTDSPLSPLVGPAAEAYFFAAQGSGPFDSLTGALALVNALVAAVATRLRITATRRLDAIENAWMANGLLVAGPTQDVPLSGLQVAAGAGGDTDSTAAGRPDADSDGMAAVGRNAESEGTEPRGQSADSDSVAAGVPGSDIGR